LGLTLGLALGQTLGLTLGLTLWPESQADRVGFPLDVRPVTPPLVEEVYPLNIVVR
jgi:hypothetical protein